MNASKLDAAAEGSPPPPCETITVVGPAEARGRNGWFTPAEIGVQRSEADAAVWLSVRSSRPFVDMPPVWLSLCLADAESLHRALGRQLATLASTTADEAVGHDG